MDLSFWIQEIEGWGYVLMTSRSSSSILGILSNILKKVQNYAIKSDFPTYLKHSIPVPMKTDSRPRFQHQQLGLSSIQTHNTAEPAIPFRSALGHIKVEMFHYAPLFHYRKTTSSGHPKPCERIWVASQVADETHDGAIVVI